jgi:DNA mismatch repair ATPase MutL
MKSLVQEAVSIAKAIDAAWLHAGKPENFSIKILEHPQKNFLGFSKKSAKIAFFFDEIKQPAAKQPYKGQTQQQQQRPAGQPQQRPATQAQPQQQRPIQKNTPPAAKPSTNNREDIQAHAPLQQRPLADRHAKQPEKAQPIQVPLQERIDEQKRLALWNSEQIETARIWISEMLTFMNRAQVPFTVEQDDLILKISFKEPIIGASIDSAQEKKLFTHLSLLLMTILKKQYRSAFRGHRILFTHQQ